MGSKLIFFFSFLLLFSCSDKESTPTVAIGDANYGGELRFMSAEKISNLFPLSSIDIYEQRISNQIFETLLKMDKNGSEAIPSLAESYTVSSDAKTYTFKIRKGVVFHDDACFSSGSGREITAEDVKFCMEMACSGLSENKIGNLLTNKIKGAKKFHASTFGAIDDKTVEGIVVVDAHTLRISLEESFTGFDKMLTHPNLGIFPKEAYEKYGDQIKKHPVGTGPFRLTSWNASGIGLERNPHYWRKDANGNQLPFLEKVTMFYSRTKKDELLAFRKQKIDMILQIPADEIENILGTLQEAQAGKNVKHKVDSKHSMSLNYYGFANGVKPFNDVRVRKAFNLALDRNELVTTWLKGEGYPVKNGFVPEMTDYPSERVKGFARNVEKAKELLAQAGFPNGAGFPVLEIYVNTSDGSSAHLLTQGIQSQLKNTLNVDLKIKFCSLKEREAAIKNGKALIWKSGWVADYPDAENFLDLFYSGENSALGTNPFRFYNEEFNQNLEAAMKEKNTSDRVDYLVKCDQIIIDEAVVMPIFNDDFITMVNAKVRNFETNSMEILDFSTIFIREPKK